MVDSSQLTQGGSKLRRSCQSTIGERPVQIYVILTGISEQPDLRKRILKYRDKKKNTGWIFIIIGWMCTHISNTHLCSKNLKREFCI